MRLHTSSFIVSASLIASALLLLCLGSLLLGAGDIGVGESMRALFGAAGPEAQFVVGVLRRARTELAVLVGMALGVAGLLLQSVTRNPLAEPGLLGVSAGAAFPVTLSINLGATAAGLHLGVAVPLTSRVATRSGACSGLTYGADDDTGSVDNAFFRQRCHHPRRTHAYDSHRNPSSERYVDRLGCGGRRPAWAGLVIGARDCPLPEQVARRSGAECRMVWFPAHAVSRLGWQNCPGADGWWSVSPGTVTVRRWGALAFAACCISSQSPPLPSSSDWSSAMCCSRVPVLIWPALRPARSTCQGRPAERAQGNSREALWRQRKGMRTIARRHRVACSRSPAQGQRRPGCDGRQAR